MLRDMLKLKGFEVGRKHNATLMTKTGIAAIYRQRPGVLQCRASAFIARWKNADTAYNVLNALHKVA